MRFSSLKTLFLTTALILPSITFSWNGTGHMVIADIAYAQIDPIVKEKVDDLVDAMHQEYSDIFNFVEMAAWADNLKSQRIDVYNHWHYADYAFSTDGSPLKDLLDTDNAVYVMKDIQLVVKNDRANRYERARFLAFLEHVIGDLHQPLHTVSNISAENPNGDKGGNAYYVNYKGQKANLHYIWDSGLGVFSPEATPTNIEAIANQIMQHYPESYFGKRADDLSIDTMTKEGMENAKQYVYSVSMNETITEQYIVTGQQIAEQEAALAGYRLAKLLELLFK